MVAGGLQWIEEGNGGTTRLGGREARISLVSGSTSRRF